jgi:hypothetical protein
LAQGGPNGVPRLASAVVFAERAVYYAAALSLLVTIAPVFFSTVVSVLRVAEAGEPGKAFEVSTVLVIPLSAAPWFTRRAGRRE